jgi:hypothetical protein
MKATSIFPLAGIRMFTTFMSGYVFRMLVDQGCTCFKRATYQEVLIFFFLFDFFAVTGRLEKQATAQMMRVSLTMAKTHKQALEGPWQNQHSMLCGI